MCEISIEYFFLIGQSPARSIDQLSEGLRSTLDVSTPRKETF